MTSIKSQNNTSTFHCPSRVIGHMIKLPPSTILFFFFINLSKPGNLTAFFLRFTDTSEVLLTSLTSTALVEQARRAMVMMVFPRPIASARIFKSTTSQHFFFFYKLQVSIKYTVVSIYEIEDVLLLLPFEEYSEIPLWHHPKMHSGTQRALAYTKLRGKQRVMENSINQRDSRERKKIRILIYILVCKLICLPARVKGRCRCIHTLTLFELRHPMESLFLVRAKFALKCTRRVTFLKKWNCRC